MAKKQEKKTTDPAAPAPIPRLWTRYAEEVRPKMVEKFGYKNPMQVPKLVKMTVSMGVGEGTRDIKVLENAEVELGLITGQKPKRTRATKSIAQFKLREGMPVGCFVTLRGARMFEFLDRLISVAIPRIRDFRGLPSKSFDGRGNHAMGVKEHLIFMELDHSKVSKDQGLNIVTVTSAKTDEEALELLRLFGMPFQEV
jgi:large subunit ribosomal protein L5